MSTQLGTDKVYLVPNGTKPVAIALPAVSGVGASFCVFWVEQSQGDWKAGRYRYDTQVWSQYQLKAGTGSADGHMTPCGILLDSGGARPGQILTAFQGFESPLQNVTTRGRGVSAVNASVQVDAGNCVYNALMQALTSKRVFVFHHKDDTSSTDASTYLHYTDDGGATWSGRNQIVANSPNRPTFYVWGNGTDRIDIVFTRGDPGDAGVINDLFHGYLAIAADGTWTAKATDGTTVTLPFTPSNATKIYDGNTPHTSCSVCDLAVVNGVLNAGFCYWPNSGGSPDFTQSYTFARVQLTYPSGTSWSAKEDIASGGSYAPPGVQNQYTQSGFCFSQRTVDRVYLTYATAGPGGGGKPTRIELRQYDKSAGTWNLTTTIEGAANNIACNPNVVYDPTGALPAEQIVYQGNGTVTSPTVWTTKLMTYPALTVASTYTAAVKPPPVWNALAAANVVPGCQEDCPLVNSAGAAKNYAPNGADLVQSGSPTRATGSYGDEYSGFSPGINFVQTVSTTQLPANNLVGSYPVWQAVLAKTTEASAANYPCGHGNTGNTQQFGGNINSAAAGDVALTARGDDAVTTTGGGGTSPTFSDGNYFVKVDVLWDSTHREVYVFTRDGAGGLVAGGASGTLGNPCTVNRWALGGQYYNGSVYTAAWNPGAIVCGAWGRGVTFDLHDLANNWLGGLFAEITAAANSHLLACLGCGA